MARTDKKSSRVRHGVGVFTARFGEIIYKTPLLSLWWLARIPPQREPTEGVVGRFWLALTISCEVVILHYFTLRPPLRPSLLARSEGIDGVVCREWTDPSVADATSGKLPREKNAGKCDIPNVEDDANCPKAEGQATNFAGFARASLSSRPPAIDHQLHREIRFSSPSNDT